jgi:hypothetical protein
MFGRERLTPVGWAISVFAAACVLVAAVTIYRAVRGPEPVRVDPERESRPGRSQFMPRTAPNPDAVRGRQNRGR